MLVVVDVILSYVSARQGMRFELTYLQVVKLLAYISDKDLFAEFYR